MMTSLVGGDAVLIARLLYRVKYFFQQDDKKDQGGL
jgi:hypothetical protein